VARKENTPSSGNNLCGEEVMNENLPSNQPGQRSSHEAEKLERLRDEFAMAAMTSIITVAEKAGWHWQQSEGFYETVAKKSYMAADQMLKAREQSK
jgi:hypothetical protein